VVLAEPVPVKEQFWQPAEWATHEAVWVAWPSAQDLWKDHLQAAQEAFAAMCEAIADPDPETRRPRGERIELLVPDEARRREAMKRLRPVAPRVHAIAFGDIWLRDTAPVFVVSDEGEMRASCFGFNGWGGKYVLPGDDQVAAQIARASEVLPVSYDWVMEGGSVEVDGEGTVLTTRQCLLNPNRKLSRAVAAPPEPQSPDEARVEARLQEALGIKKVLWLDEGLENDHTDGHIDTIARFVRPGVVACMEPFGHDDPNRDVLIAIQRQLSSMSDARGRALEVVRVPSPGRILSPDQEIMPASYVNFYIGNRAVVVPTYGSPNDEHAVSTVARMFPARRTVGIDAKAILSGGGAFHCITQQEPFVPLRGEP
jgi:agmatine deiminase